MSTPVFGAWHVNLEDGPHPALASASLAPRRHNARLGDCRAERSSAFVAASNIAMASASTASPATARPPALAIVAMTASAAFPSSRQLTLTDEPFFAASSAQSAADPT
jgi:hypothetical protein